MSSFDKIRQLYHPLQVVVKKSDDNVIYEEFLPYVRLQPFIYCYWQHTTKPYQMTERIQ